MEMCTLEYLSELGHLEIPKKDVPSGADRPNISPRLVKQIPAPSVDPERKRSVDLIVLEEARVLSAPLGIASYL